MAASPLSRAPAASTAQRGQNATSGSTTQTVSTRPPSTQLQQPVLRLRGAMRGSGERSQRRIQWAEDVIDNEGLGRKSSKGMVCLSMFHWHLKETYIMGGLALMMTQCAASTTHPRLHSMNPRTRAPRTPPTPTPTAAMTAPHAP